jgi:hypothetical protein
VCGSDTHYGPDLWAVSGRAVQPLPEHALLRDPAR